MEIIRCIVLEDEEPAQNLMRNYFNRIPELELVEVFDNALDASDFLRNNTVDLIFTDIEMPRLTGLDFIRMLSPKPQIIIITAYPNFALESYELDVLDYLKKPVTFDRFKQGIEKVKRNLGFNFAQENGKNESLFILVKENGKTIKVELDKIVYVEGLKDYVKIIIDEDRPIITHSTMKKMEEYLAPPKFIRVHKSYIISADRIASFDPTNSIIELKHKVEIPVGPLYKEELIKKMKPIN
jgi:DNA-binding LytR/AlgR family response regulator